jgi:hypothetical protein
LGDGRLATARFFAVLRLADFPVAAMAVSRFGVSLRPGRKATRRARTR